MILRDGSQSNTGLHSNSASNTSAIGWRSFSFGYYMTNTGGWNDLMYFSVVSLPAQLSMGFFWFSVSQRNSGVQENWDAARSARAHHNGYSFEETGGNNYSEAGNGISQGGSIQGNGYNSVVMRDWPWAGTPCYVTYHLDVFSNRWDIINCNYS